MRALLSSHADLREVLTTPAVAPQKKRAILTAVLEAAGGASAELTRLLWLLADRDRLALVPDIAEAFAEKMREASKVMPAEVTTAVPLGDARRAQLAKAIGQAAGCHVTITERVDPSIIGGIIARVGSVVFDGSVTRQLERMRHTLGES